MLCIIRKVIKCRLSWYRFQKRCLKLLVFETSNMVYVNEKVFDNYDVLYIVEKLLKNAIQRKQFRKTVFVQVYDQIYLLFVFEYV